MLTDLIHSEALLDNIGVAVVLHDVDTTIKFANQSALKLLGMTIEEVQGVDASDSKWRFVDEFNQPMAVEDYPVSRVLAAGSPVRNMILGIEDSLNSQITWVLINAFPIFAKNQTLQSVAVTFVDISQHKQSIPFESVVKHANDIVLVTEAQKITGPDHPKIVYVNKAFENLTGYSAEEVIGKTPRILQGPETSDEAKACIKQAIENYEPVHCQLLNYAKDGTQYWIELNIFPLKNFLGEVVYFAAIERDISLQKLREDKLKQQADSDYLTKLPNRRGFFAAAKVQLQNLGAEAVSIAVIDIDLFKNFNDQYGHAMGDKVLKILAQQLIQNFRSADELVRLGGEEFAVLLSKANRDVAVKLMETFKNRLANINISSPDGKSTGITVSIGIHSSIAESESIESMLDKADQALYQAKQNGRNQIVVFSPGTAK